VYLNQLTYGANTRFEGLNVSGRVQVGRNAVIAPSLSVNGATATALDSRFMQPGSFYYPWTQLPGLPLVRANLTFDALQGRSNLEWIVNAQYTGRNNPENQPAYALLNVALLQQSGAQKVSLRVTNVLNTGFQYFALGGTGTTYVTRSGSAVLLPTQPLGPRTISITYHFAGVTKAHQAGK